MHSPKTTYAVDQRLVCIDDICQLDTQNKSFLDTKDLLPGGTVTKTLEIVNKTDGDIQMKAKLTAEAQTFLQYTYLTLQTKSTVILENLSLRATTKNMTTNLGRINRGESIIFELLFKLDEKTPNEVQNVTEKLELEFFITQGQTETIIPADAPSELAVAGEVSGAQTYGNSYHVISISRYLWLIMLIVCLVLALLVLIALIKYITNSKRQK